MMRAGGASPTTPPSTLAVMQAATHQLSCLCMMRAGGPSPRKSPSTPGTSKAAGNAAPSPFGTTQGGRTSTSGVTSASSSMRRCSFSLVLVWGGIPMCCPRKNVYSQVKGRCRKSASGVTSASSSMRRCILFWCLSFGGIPVCCPRKDLYSQI